MYKITAVQTRPSTSVQFWGPTTPGVTEEHTQYFRETYVNTGKQLDFSAQVSNDGLQLTTTLIWKDQESLQEWKNDPLIKSRFFDVQEAYLNAHGITITRSAEEI